MKLVVAAAAAFLLASPVQAQSEWNFYQRCQTGIEAGSLNRTYCHDYLLGFYDALAATDASAHNTRRTTPSSSW